MTHLRALLNLMRYQRVFMSRYTHTVTTIDILFLLFTFVANYDSNNDPYLLYCDDLESRLNEDDITPKNSTTMSQAIDHHEKET